MDEKDILDKLYAELRLDLWWKDLLGQPPTYGEDFDQFKAADSIPRTEQTAAQEIGRKLKNYLSYVETTNKWYIWDGKIHTPCDGEGIAYKVVKLYYETTKSAISFVKDYFTKEAQAARVSNVDKADELATKIMMSYEKGEWSKHRSFRDKLASAQGISAVVRMMRTECDVPSDYFDNDTRWFVMRNYVLDLDDLRTSVPGQPPVFTLLPHSPERPVTKYFDADYVGNVESSLGHWDNFLEKSVPVASSRKYLQQIVGAAMMGTSKLRTIPNLYGPPGSGKSVFINTLFKLGKEGAGYACMPDSKAVVKVSGQNFEQDAFKGRRIIGISEPSSTDHIDDDFLKKFTGDVWVETRTLNVKSSGWVPQGVCLIASNAPLKINTRDKAIVNRVQLIEFPIEFEEQLEGGPYIPEERRMVIDLEEKILEDRNRILTWIIVGMIDFIVGGGKLKPPPEVVAKRDEIVTSASTALRWVEEAIDNEMLEYQPHADPRDCIPVLDAYSEYSLWSALSGERKPLTRRFFTQDIETKFGEKVKDPESKQWKFAGFVMTPRYLTRNAGAAPASAAKF